MKKQKFIDNFIVSFLASWVANNYSFACSHGRHEMLENPPVEDAKMLAEAAWEKCEELL